MTSEQIKRILQHFEQRNPYFKFEATMYSMYHLEGLSYREIAAKTNVPKNAVFEAVQHAQVLIDHYIRKYKC